MTAALKERPLAGKQPSDLERALAAAIGGREDATAELGTMVQAAAIMKRWGFSTAAMEIQLCTAGLHTQRVQALMDEKVLRDAMAIVCR